MLSSRFIILKSKNIDWWVYLPTIGLFAAASVVLLMGGHSLETSLSGILNWLTNNMSWLYMSVYVITFIFFIYLGFSKLGKTKLGDPDDKPEFSTYHWGSMVYATGIDASILMLSMVDPLRYLQSPSFGVKPFSTSAYNYAHMLGQFNWGPMAWMMFAPATIAIAYAMYVKHIKVQRLSAAISVLQGPGKGKQIARNTIDFLVIIGIMGGVGTSVGMEIPVISKVLSAVTGIADTMTLKLGLFALLFVIFAMAVFNGLKKGTIVGKGAINNRMTNLLFQKIEAEGVPTHFIQELNDRETAVRRVEIVPLEVIVRNVAAGSFSKRLGVEEGTVLAEPTIEFSYKNDELGDPLINSHFAKALQLATASEIKTIKDYAFKINEILKVEYLKAGLRLIDFKIEFGRFHGKIILADEISPDTCRLWDVESGEKMDKDRFRRDLGGVEDAYIQVAKRLGLEMESK